MYRIFRGYDNKSIKIIKHDREWDAADVIIECCGSGPFNYVYETKGNLIDEFPTGGSFSWSNKRVVEFVEETIADRISGRYF